MQLLKWVAIHEPRFIKRCSFIAKCSLVARLGVNKVIVKYLKDSRDKSIHQMISNASRYKYIYTACQIDWGTKAC